MSLKANRALKAVFDFPSPGAVTDTYTCTNMPQAPLLCNQKPRVAVGTGKERVGREKERLDRVSIKSITKLQAVVSICPLLPVPFENTHSFRDTHLTCGYDSSDKVNINHSKLILFLLSHTRKHHE